MTSIGEIPPEPPQRSVEIERTYDVDSGASLPDWCALADVVTVAALGIRELDAVYFDTADMELAHAGVALRRRSGGPDAGWHVKIGSGQQRTEWRWPLSDADEVPEPVAEAVAAWTREPLTAVARIRNERHAYALVGGHGERIAEVADDHVTALALRTGRERRWREWEVELDSDRDPAGAAEFFRAVDDLVLAAGARRAAVDSKLARALSD